MSILIDGASKFSIISHGIISQLGNFVKYFYRRSGINIDFSQVCFYEEFLSNMHDKIMNDFDEMLALETGATANKNENQVVG